MNLHEEPSDPTAAVIHRMAAVASTLDLDEAIEAIAALLARAADCTRVDVQVVPSEPERPRDADEGVWSAAVPIPGRGFATMRFVRPSTAELSAAEHSRLEVLAAAAGAALATALTREDLGARTRDLAAFNDLGVRIARPHEIEQVLDLGVELLARMLRCPYAAVFALDDSGAVLRAIATHVENARAQKAAIALDTATVVARAIGAGHPLTAREALPGVSTPPPSPPSHVLAVPLVDRGASIGAIVLARPIEKSPFGEDEILRSVTVANQLAGAIAKARLQEGERGQVQNLLLLSDVARAVAATLDRDVLLSECLARICRVMGFETASASVLETTGEEPIYETVVRFPRAAPPLHIAGLLERSALRAAPVTEQHEDAEGTLYAVAVPLIAAREVVGVVSFGRRTGAVSDAETSTLAAIGAEIAVGLEHCRLFSEAQRRVRELGLLLDVGRAVTASLDLDRILETSAGILTRMIDASTSFILLLDAATSTLHGVATSNEAYREQFRTVRIRLSERSLAARCVRERSTVVVRDALQSDEVHRGLVDLYGEKSLLALPLLVRGEPIGAVVVDDVRDKRAWSRAEIERAELVVHQIAVAVANARLFEDLKRSYVELGRAQEALVQRERLAALGELAAVMAHEVRNPLGVIFNSLATLEKTVGASEEAAVLLGIVREEADRLNHLVRDLLEFARPRAPSFQDESLAAVVEGAVLAATTEPVQNVRIETHVPADLPLVRIDARMIRRAIVNLVLNGVQAMARTGGTLRVRVAIEEDDADTAPVKAPAIDRRMARIDVEDTGPGIAPEAAARMFQPFFTTKATGTGLGLAVVKSIVDAHRGKLEVTSRAGVGTVFTMRLPVSGRVPEPRDGPLEHATRPDSSGTAGQGVEAASASPSTVIVRSQ